jgi:hypothetical protein
MPADPSAALAIKVVLGVVCALGLLLFYRQEWGKRRSYVPHPETVLRAPIEPSERFASNVRIERIAELYLPTGAIVACDPLAGPDTPPLERTVTPGTYPVELAFDSDQMHSAVRVVFADGAPTRWELAGSYGVDAGVGCFMDAATAKSMLERADQLGPDEDYFSTVLHGELDDMRVDHHPVDGQRENCVIVQSGGGDGYYDCYWGLGDDGRVLQLVTDFA